jgi:ribosomal protein L34
MVMAIDFSALRRRSGVGFAERIDTREGRI